MTALDWLTDSLIAELALVLAHFLWQGALLAAATWCALTVARRTSPNVRYAIALVGFLLLATAPVITFAWRSTEYPVLSTQYPVLNTQYEAPFTTDRSAITSDVPSPTPHSALRISHSINSWLVAAWLLGVFLMTARLALGGLTVLRLRRASESPGDELLLRAALLWSRLSRARPPLVGASRRVAEAMVVGVFRPAVLIPAAWLIELPPHVLDSILAHELAHVRRWDPWVNAFQCVVETLLFYHPAVWWLSRRIRIEREYCCDELAVRLTGQPVVYAQTLELVARRKLDRRVPVLASGIGDRNMNLLQRVKHVLGRSGDDRPSGWVSPLLATLAIVAGLVVYRMALATPSPIFADEGDDRAAAERQRDEAVERERNARREADRARREAQENVERARGAEREARERAERGEQEARERGGPGPEAAQIIHRLQEEIEQLRNRLAETERRVQAPGDGPGGRDGERRAMSQQQFPGAAPPRGGERGPGRDGPGREPGADRPRPSGDDGRRPDGAPRAPENARGERPVPPLLRGFEVERGDGLRPPFAGQGGPEIRSELNEIRQQVRQLAEAVQGLQRALESRGREEGRGPGVGPERGRGPEGDRGPEAGRRPDGDRGPEAPRGPGAGRGPDVGRQPESDRGPGPEGLRGPGGGGLGRRPDGNRPEGGPRPERPDAARRPEGERGAGDRRPDGERREGGDRRPEGERRDGDRRPEGDRRPAGERRESAEVELQLEDLVAGQLLEALRSIEVELSPSPKP